MFESSKVKPQSHEMGGGILGTCFVYLAGENNIISRYPGDMEQ